MTLVLLGGLCQVNNFLSGILLYYYLGDIWFLHLFASAVCGQTPQDLEDQHNDVMKKMFEDKFAKSVAQVVNVTQDNDADH